MKTDTDQIIAEHFINTSIGEAVHVIEKLDYVEIADFIQEMPLDLATKVMIQMNNYKVAKCLERMNMDFVLKVFGNIDLLSAELILRQCDEEYRNTLLNKMAPNSAGKIRQRLKYGINSVGTCMKSKVFTLQKDIAVSEAMELMKKEREMISPEIFVINENAIIEGIVRVQHLVLAEGSTLISSILTKDFPEIFADELIQEIVDHPAWIKYRTLPVVGGSNVLIGSLSFEDVRKRILTKDIELIRGGGETVKALGELYMIGLTGILQSFSKTE